MQLAEERFNDPAASWIQIGERLGVTRRTTHRWRQDPRWDDVFTAAARRHVSQLIPAALKALLRSWDLGRGEHEALQVLQSSGLLAGKTVEVKHSGDVHVGIDLAATRQRVIDRIEALRVDPSSPAPTDALMVRRLPVIDADVIDRNGSGSDS